MVIPDERPDPNYVATKTNWYMSSVPAMWHYVNLQLDAHYKQADGWKMASELTSLYHSRLMSYRENFIDGWRNSPAQEAFITELDKLIKSVENTRDIASANHTASADIPHSILEAKWKLDSIVQAYNKAAGDQAKIDSGQPSTTPSPSASGEKPKTPKDIMNDKLYEAAPIMYDLSRNLVRVEQAMVPPAPYAGPGRGTRRDGTGDPSGSPNLPPAIIPPIIPPPPPPVVPTGPVTPLPTPTAPDLSSLNPTQPRPLVPTTPSLPGPVVPQQPGLIQPLPPTPTGPMPTGMRPPLTATGLPGVPGISGTPRTTGALPPGGMIGGAPGAPGARGAGARPLPPGGMIGGAGAGGRGAGMGAPGAPGMGGRGGPMGGMPGRPGHGQSDEDHEDFDPDTQWQVAQGVTPVVDTPDAPRVINPGPAIGLD